MNDRLADLRLQLLADKHTPAPDVVVEIGEEMEVPIAYHPPKNRTEHAQPEFMAEFFAGVENVKVQISVLKIAAEMDKFMVSYPRLRCTRLSMLLLPPQADIAAIREATKSITKLNEQAVLATSQETEVSRQLELLVRETTKLASHAKALLQKMKADTESLSHAKQSDLRIRANLGNTLTRKFVDVMKDYQLAQQKYKTDIKKKLVRQVLIVKPDASGDEIDALLKGGNLNEIFRTAILTGEAAEPIRNLHSNIADKYQEVLTLEASVTELQQMFLDFAMLTERQGELLDQIEYQVNSTTDFVRDGNVSIVHAVDYQKSIRKKQCILFFICLVIGGVVVAAIEGTSSTK